MIDLIKLRPSSTVPRSRCLGCDGPVSGTEPREGRWIAFCRHCLTAMQIGGPNHGKMLEVEDG